MLVVTLPLSEALLAGFARRFSRYADRGADIVEIRIDTAPELIPRLLSLLSSATLPVIVTARLPKDGGRWAGTETERRDALLAAAKNGAAYVDIEVDCPWGGELCSAKDAFGVTRFALASRPRVASEPQSDCKLILSHHNLERTDRKELERVIEATRDVPHDILKLATHANMLCDNLIHRDIFKKHGDKKLAAFCMGGSGIPSRVMALFWGSALTYCAADDDETLAPGMLTLDAMTRIYRVKRQQPPKYVLGVIGSAVQHSLSPLLHNPALYEFGVYLPLETTSFEDAMAFADAIEANALSVTTPFKERAARLGRSFMSRILSGMGQRSNTAANTLTRRRYGWDASNTDIEGFLRDLLHYTDNTRLSDCRTLVLGSGGAAFAVMQALKGRCKRLCVFARNREKGRALAAKHKAIFIEQPYSYGTPFSLVINATSAGMAGGPAENEVPVDLASLPLESNAAVYDLVYNPPETPFLKEANRLGLRARGGLGMLVQQAHAQLLSWSMLHGGSIFTCAGQEELDEQALSYALHRKHIYPPQCIALVGYRGAGKTTVGQRLADKLGLLLVDLDREIENRIQQSIADIFAREGEAAFRKYEEQALKACCQMLPPYVLAVGGGIVETPACRKMLREHYTVIWLDASPEVLRERLSKDSTRPALEAGGIDEELRVRLPRRTPFYESIADFIVKVEPGDDVDTTTRKVLSFLVPQA